MARRTGCGAAAALGAVFRNAAGEAFVPVGATLAEVAEIDLSGLHPALASAELVTMCDIDTPLCGPLGAAHVFAPQKGADPAMVELLDAGLAHLADVVERCTGRDIRQLHGAGAAGGGKVDRRIAGRMVLAWLLTFPACALLGYVLSKWMFHLA